MTTSSETRAPAPRGFRDELAPWLLVADNDLESARVRLAAEVDAAAAIDEALARIDVERTALVGAPLTDGGVFDPMRHARRLAWLVKLDERRAAVRARSDDARIRIDTAREQCLAASRRVRALEERREEVISHWQIERNRRELTQADADWIARVEWRQDQDANNGSHQEATP